MFARTKIFYLFASLLLPCFLPLLQGDTFNGPTTLIDRTFDHLEINGPADLRRVKAGSLTVHGPVRFFDLQVSGDTTINGPTKGRKAHFGNVKVKGFLKAKEVRIANLEVYGPVKLWWFTIDGDTKVYGRLKAMQGQFENLRAGSRAGGELNLLLDNIRAKNIVINAGAAPEKVTISGNTEILGSLTFESKHGLVAKKGEQIDIRGGVIGEKEAP